MIRVSTSAAATCESLELRTPLSPRGPRLDRGDQQGPAIVRGAVALCPIAPTTREVMPSASLFSGACGDATRRQEGAGQTVREAVTEDIEVTGVASGLVDHVHKDPAHVDRSDSERRDRGNVTERVALAERDAAAFAHAER